MGSFALSGQILQNRFLKKFNFAQYRRK